MKKSRVLVLALATVSFCCIGVGRNVSGADPEAPPLSSYEAQKKWIEGTGPSSTFLLETARVTRQGDHFLVTSPGSNDETYTGKELLARIKQVAARNGTLEGRYLHESDLPNGMDDLNALLRKRESVGQRFIYIFTVSSFGPKGVEIYEVLGPNEVEITYSDEVIVTSYADLRKRLGRDSPAQLTACKSNLKNTAVALEMYYTDNSSYPRQLSKLAPDYLKRVLSCPVAPGSNYSYELAGSPAAYTMTCTGSKHRTVGLEPDFPRYSSYVGMINGSKEMPAK